MKKILLAPDSFKGTLTAMEVCEILESVIRRYYPSCEIIKTPLSDGGEGFVDCLLAALEGEKTWVTVNGPMGEEVRTAYGVLPNGTVAIEMAAASGLTLVEPGARDPLKASTFGTGQLIRHALKQGQREFVIGLGGSATIDGGAGAAAALGISYRTRDGKEIISGSDLVLLDHIDSSRMDHGLQESTIRLACDVTNPLFGVQGAARIFGPQKGATNDQVRILDEGLENLNEVLKRETGIDVQMLAGSGAAGGLGAPFIAFARAQICRGLDLVLDAVEFDQKLISADLVISGEGRTDAQSAMGKVLSGVGMRAKQKGVPVIAISGALGEGYEALYDQGISALFSTVRQPASLDDILKNAQGNLTRTSEDIFRLLKSLGV
jgi:glycerate kinase